MSGTEGASGRAGPEKQRPSFSREQNAGETIPQSLAGRLSELEREIDAGSYRPGAWQAWLREARRRPRAERIALAEAISRVSEKLHARAPRRRVALGAGLLAECALALIGAVLLGLAVRDGSNAAAVVAAMLWAMSFQPLFKLAVGSMLGVRYAYAYFLGLEPRFKMRYGTYVAAPRAARIIFHLSGMIGSSLGAWLPIPFLSPDLRPAIIICWVLFGLTAATNVVPFLMALTGIGRVGPLRLSLASAGSAALEIREALRR